MNNQCLNRFFLSVEQMKFLSSPNTFYKTILSLIEKATKRITITSLYLGTGKLESTLINKLYSKTREKDIKLTIIMDKNRCERKEKGRNSLDLLLPLKNNLYLYNNPNFSSFPFNKHIPSIFKELFGVFHTKIIIADNDIILTGANLSNSYFTTRKDRYLYIKNSPMLANYLSQYANDIKSINFSQNAKEYIRNHHNILKQYNCNTKPNIKQLIDSIPNNKILLIPTVRI